MSGVRGCVQGCVWGTRVCRGTSVRGYIMYVVFSTKEGGEGGKEGGKEERREGWKAY